MPECRNGHEEKHRILVAEDDPATLALLKRQLERAGYAVTACTDGQEALAALTNAGAEVVVADWQMPNMTGLELCRAVSELRAERATSPLHFILLTAHGDKGKLVEGLEAGADDFLTKPYDLEELLARIRAGVRVLLLQDELIRRQMELSKSGAQLAILNQKLTKLANFDSLTELPNRRCILERFQEAWELAERRCRLLSCIMFDVDHFKKVNDTYGHKAGDVVLHGMAEIVRTVTRRYDLCGRFGGEEFLLLSPDETVDGAVVLAERVRIAVAEQPIVVDGKSVSVTVSLGVAAKRPEHATPDALIAEADTMLYAAKRNGRNRVWQADAHGQAHPFEPAAARASETPPSNPQGSHASAPAVE